MDYALLVRKLNNLDKKYITSEEIKEYCRIINMTYYDAIRYLTKNKYLYTILRGIFYKPSIEERKLRKINTGHLEALAEALKIKGIDNWYLGLDSALKMNNATHEFFSMEIIINDTIFRKNPINIFGNKIRFIKVKPVIVSIGIKNSGILRYSDIEKTVLDIIYLSKYSGNNADEIKNKVKPLNVLCSKNKLKDYAKKYNSEVERFMEGL